MLEYQLRKLLVFSLVIISLFLLSWCPRISEVKIRLARPGPAYPALSPGFRQISEAHENWAINDPAQVIHRASGRDYDLFVSLFMLNRIFDV